MPCSAVTVDYRRDSAAMPVPITKSILEPEYSRLKFNTLSSSCSRRTSGSSPFVTELVQKYSSTRTGLGSRSSSLTDDTRDRSQTRDSSTLRSRTTSYSSESSTQSHRKPTTNYTTFDLNEFRITYAPSSYIPGSTRSELSRPPRSTESLRTRASTSILREKKSEIAEGTNLEVISPDKTKETSNLINGDVAKEDKTDDGSELSLLEVNSSAIKHDGASETNDSADVVSLVCGVVTFSYRVLGNISPRHFRSAANTSRKEVTASSSLSSTSNGLSGLRNIGNTCFLNSVVQCLSNTKVLKEFLINKEFMSEIRNSESRGALIKSFSEVIMELWSGEGKVVNTTAFKAQIQRYAPRFMGYNQQDAQEFLRYLLEGLHDDINRVAVKPRNLPEIDDNLSDSLKASECWKQYLRCDNSRIVDLFVGQLKSTLQCTSCGHSSTTFEVFWDLSLPLPSRSGSLRLSQCLDHFTKEEVLDGDEMPTCCKCKTRRKCTKRFSIQKFPKILVLHLKRFSPSERYRKLSATVEFPLTNLDMSGYSTTPQVATYNLYAVSNHSGTAYSGHYTAYCLHSGSGHWYEFNDSRVSSISPRSVVSSEAYILFYEQNTAVTTSRL
ncbi:ubiquitin carboxyl-terminal hydrolase 2 isoform X1 [Halyomorpha halys]|uniref:ubiquitin carboxyl-terminal hydrolase 2 isoform X1 n=1 Tax=Halyomorpha halys TaxID=286706 RepID=UPI0006D51AD9|nr:ubiquitin carboxyl-terminal hydrolase 2-like isoform X1 [Halyomorpha halys]XP_014277448.1 ubiquitin carboxyl-terminal hydrolase 2-like isoform X1 [Halyomorpha halys]XP_014277449.1 ubiquitin carboxyl-terminal hydrolase 2-like isoform X1 [Halyomorpha halys]XP_014277450.1 ubiquitin carboxyl-terminal hydrolase 2-like isoform X1 [Halyomorpha halys]XP_014277451.1 ubiquitin carboxyl-terminal hydrolase 2-like isoform X1 [Halyomorpha halys]